MAFALASDIHASQRRKEVSISYLANLMAVAALALGIPCWRRRRDHGALLSL